MGKMTRRGNWDLPHPGPVEKIQLSERHIRLRTGLAVLFFVIGASALIYGFLGLLGGGDGGWREITASSTGKEHCGGEFVFQYDIEGDGPAVRTQVRQLTDLYTEAMVHAYQLFHSQSFFEGVNNLHAINRCPGEALTVEPALYEALWLLQESGCREQYLGPVYVQYGNLFAAESDEQAMEFDPFLNPEAGAACREMAAYAADPAAVRVELLEDRQVRLVLSDEYAGYARENGITEFVDLGWMRNAFVIDYVAQALEAQGYTRGVLSSYDGFTRNLDRRGGGYAYPLFDRREQNIYEAGILEYNRPVSMVFLRDYPMNRLDTLQYYEWESGEIRFPYVDVESGLCKAALHNLVGYSYEGGCARVLLSLLPVYVADSFAPEALQGLAEEGIYSIYCQGQRVYRTEEAAEIVEVHDGYRASRKAAPCLISGILKFVAGEAGDALKARL
ncbi:MAG: hypothetical protein HFH80_10205 [Lachnospiraceae bacterium]|nr:hypothetical protein [Lachnospiraceae bacterium]